MDDVASALQQMVQNHVPSALSAQGFGHDVPLGAGGLGMDSVAVVMVLLECEARWGIAFPAEMLERPLTLNRMIQHLTDQSAT